jgi:hypothetical protein
MKKSEQEKMMISLIKKLNQHNDDELFKINNSLNSLYKEFSKKRSSVDFIESFNKKVNSEEFKIFTEYSTIIDKYISNFTDYYLKRNISIIQFTIQEVLDKRHRIILPKI